MLGSVDLWEHKAQGWLVLRLGVDGSKLTQALLYTRTQDQPALEAGARDNWLYVVCPTVAIILSDCGCQIQTRGSSVRGAAATGIPCSCGYD